MQQISTSGRAPPGPVAVGGAYRAPPDPLVILRGLLLRGRGRDVMGQQESGGRGDEGRRG